MNIFTKIASAQAQCPSGKIVIYDLEGRIAYIKPSDFPQWEARGYTKAPDSIAVATAPAPLIAPAPEGEGRKATIRTKLK